MAPHSRGTTVGLTSTIAFIVFAGPFVGGLAFASNRPFGLFTLYAGSAMLRLVISVTLFRSHPAPSEPRPLENLYPK